MSTNQHKNMSESASGPQQAPIIEQSAVHAPQAPRAEYVYGEDLHAIQQSNKELLGIDATPHKVWQKGKTLTLFLRDAEDWTQKSQPGSDYEDKGLAKSMAESMRDRADKVREDIRQKFLKDGHAPEDLTDEKIDYYTAQRIARFEAHTDAEAEGVEQVKRLFMVRMQIALEHQGLPINNQQLQDRLKGLTVGIVDPLNFSEKVRGQYMSQVHHIEVSSELDVHDYHHVLFHELVHAMSGKRLAKKQDSHLGSTQRSIGLEAPQSRIWLNEGVTEMLAYVLWDSSGLQLDFGHTKKPLIDVTTTKGQRLLANMQEFLKSDSFSSDEYRHFNAVAVKMFTQVPAHVLMRAVFAQNNDPYETDQMAGTHAERDLQRALKVVGGVGMLKKMRVVEHAFKTQNYDLANSIAEEAVANPASALGLFINKRHMAGHTKKYKAQIEKAKQRRKAA